MKEFSYKQTTTTKLQAIGFLDIANLTIEIEGESKKLSDLLKDFDGCAVTLSCQTKEETDFE